MAGKKEMQKPYWTNPDPKNEKPNKPMPMEKGPYRPSESAPVASQDFIYKTKQYSGTPPRKPQGSSE